MPDPFGGAGERLYATGDRVRVLAGGELEFQGRLDHQVKLRGFRIELGEIESRLVRQPGVTDAVAMVRERPSEEAGAPDRRLVAWVESAGGVGEDGLRRALAGELPEYMVPSRFVVLGVLPRLPNGKVDRKALPDPDAEAGASTYLAPRDPVERQLVAIWEEMLDRRPIGVRENFFELGGHSLLGMRLVSQVGKQLGKTLPVAALFQAPTIEQLAAVVRGEGPYDPRSSLVPLRSNGRGKPMFWIHPGTGTIFLYQQLAKHLAPERPFYALQAQGLEGDVAPITTIEGMAIFYLEEIRKVQAGGPYLLAGWSMGGVIALEMARQLAARGETVAFLGLVDARVPNRFDRLMAADDLALLRTFALNFGLPLDVAMPLDEFLALSVRERLAHLLDNVRQAGALPEGLTLEQVLRFYEIFRLNSKALPQHQPGRYPGRITLFKASKPTPVLFRRLDETWLDRLLVRGQELLERLRISVWERFVRKDVGWRRVTGASVEVHRVPGHHYDLLGPENVERLAAIVGETIAGADRIEE